MRDKPQQPNNSSTTPDSDVLPLHHNLARAARERQRRPAKGYAHNPLLTLPRNSQCPCQSGKKFKACCLAKLPPVVTAADAERFKAQMDQPDLVFLTNENQKRVLDTAAQESCEHTLHLEMGVHPETKLPWRFNLCGKCGFTAALPEDFEPSCETCNGTGIVDNGLGGFGAAAIKGPCPDCSKERR